MLGWFCSVTNPFTSRSTASCSLGLWNIESNFLKAGKLHAHVLILTLWNCTCNDTLNMHSTWLYTSWPGVWGDCPTMATYSRQKHTDSLVRESECSQSVVLLGTIHMEQHTDTTTAYQVLHFVVIQSTGEGMDGLVFTEHQYKHTNTNTSHLLRSSDIHLWYYKPFFMLTCTQEW